MQTSNTNSFNCVNKLSKGFSTGEMLRRTLLLILLLIRLVPAAEGSSMLETVKNKGFLNCGVHSSLPGFSVKDSAGWRGLETDYCRAVAAAILGDASRVRFIPLALEQGYTALQSGDLDLLVRHSKMQLETDTALGLLYVAPLYYASLGLLVRDELEVYSAVELQDVSVCMENTPHRVANFDRHLRLKEASLRSMPVNALEAAAKAFEQNRCDAVFAERSQLHYVKTLLPDTLDSRILPEDFAIQSMGPLVRSDDLDWFKIARWVLSILLSAEYLGINSENIKKLPKEIQGNWEMVGVMGISLGLSLKWHQRVIEQVGNYGEIYSRSLGADSSYQIPRGLNAHAANGGLHVAPTLD